MTEKRSAAGSESLTLSRPDEIGSAYLCALLVLAATTQSLTISSSTQRIGIHSSPTDDYGGGGVADG